MITTQALLAFDRATEQLLDADCTDRAAVVIAKLRVLFMDECVRFEAPRSPARPA